MLYVGVTNNLEQRIIEHYLNRGKPEIHTGKYYCYDLVFYETFQLVNNAIAGEKEIKEWRRDKKDSLIHSFNPGRKILNKELFAEWPMSEKNLFHRRDA